MTAQSVQSGHRVRSSGAARRRVRRGRALVPVAFLAPFLVLFAVFFVAPLLYALHLSLFRDTLILGRIFVGAENYARALGDARFWAGVWRTLQFGAVQIPLMLALALAFALVLHARATAAVGLFRIAYFLPHAVPSVIAALIWGYLFGPAFGPLAQAAAAFNLPQPNVLTHDAMLFAIGTIVTWQNTGYAMIILYAALKALPADLEEAARIGGASGVQIAWHIKIPLILPALMLVTVLSVINTLQLFNEPEIMKSLAPQVISHHYTPNLYAYSLSFVNQEYNYSAAVSFILALIVGVISYVFMIVPGRRAKWR